MGVDSTFYKVILFAHIMSVIAGTGILFLSPVLAGFARRWGPKDGVVIAQANMALSRKANGPIYAIVVLGLLLVVLSDDVWSFQQAWISVAFLSYFGMIALRQFVVMPTQKRLILVMQEVVDTSEASPPLLQELKALHKKIAMFTGFIQLLMLIALAMMIWKPGV